MNASLDEIIAKKKQKELEAAQLAEKLAKAKRRKELKRRQHNAVSSANSVSSCSTSSTIQHVLCSKENKSPNSVSTVVSTPEVSPDALKRSKDLHTDPKLLRKAGALVRDSQDPHTPIWVPGFSYPAQYCIRQTRSLSQKLQVDNVDCIDLDDCMFGSQRAKVKVEDSKSDDRSVKSEQSTKSVKRKSGRSSKRRRRSNKLSQTSDSSDCGVKLEPEQPVDGESVMQSSFGIIGDVSVSLMDEPAVVNDDVTTPVTQPAPLVESGCDTEQLQTPNNGKTAEPLMPECDDVMPSAQQPMECGNDTLVHLTQQPTGDDRTDTLVSCHTEGNDVTKPDDNPMAEDSVQQPIEDNDNTMYGLTESVLLLMDASCDQQTGCVTEACDQEHNDMTRFWCEQGSNLNSKVTLCRNDDSSHLHCNTVLKHTIGGTMVPLLRVSNIASSTTSDESDRCYVTVQLARYIVVWLHSVGWTVLNHWPVTDELDLVYFYTLPLTGGVAVCTVTNTGTWRISFVKGDITSVTTQPIVHCVSSSLWHSSVMCCWSSKGEVFMATLCRDNIVIQAVENYSEKVKKQIRLPFDGGLCSLCGMENNSTTDDEGVWLFAATLTGITIFDIVSECVLQNVSLSCSNITNSSLLPKCLRAIREDCYTFIVLGYECHEMSSHKVVGWLVAIDNSDDTRTPLPIVTGHHQTVSYAKLLREYVLPQSSPNCDSFNYLSVVHNDQLVVATTTPSQWLHRWDQFTGEVTNAWTILSDHGSIEYCIQSNSTTLALYGGEEDHGNLYIYKLDGT